MAAFIIPQVYDPFHALIFVNGSQSDIVVAFKIDHDWWLTPIVAPGRATLVVPVFEGATVDWKAISRHGCERYNAIYRSHYTIEDAGWIIEDDICEWQSQVIVSYGLLGRTQKIWLR